MIANKTTSIAATKTVSDIQAMLAHVGAKSIMIDFTDSQPSAIAFQITRENHVLSFRLPCNWQGILAALTRDKKVPRRLVNADQARRVAWRVVRDWLRAQLTLIEAGSSSIEEVMLPWAITSDGTTVSERLFSGNTGILALPAPR